MQRFAGVEPAIPECAREDQIAGRWISMTLREALAEMPSASEIIRRLNCRRKIEKPPPLGGG
jgi:hypothetical protein